MSPRTPCQCKEMAVGVEDFLSPSVKFARVLRDLLIHRSCTRGQNHHLGSRAKVARKSVGRPQAGEETITGRVVAGVLPMSAVSMRRQRAKVALAEPGGKEEIRLKDGAATAMMWQEWIRTRWEPWSTAVWKMRMRTMRVCGWIHFEGKGT